MITTQLQNVLRHLLAGPLCGVRNDYWRMGRRIAARIHELRSVGFTIETVRCDLNDHNHRGRQIMYQIAGPRSDEYLDWCAYCGPLSEPRFVGEGEEVDGWLLVQCDRCGRKDYR